MTYNMSHIVGEKESLIQGAFPTPVLGGQIENLDCLVWPRYIMVATWSEANIVDERSLPIVTQFGNKQSCNM